MVYIGGLQRKAIDFTLHGELGGVASVVALDGKAPSITIPGSRAALLSP